MKIYTLSQQGILSLRRRLLLRLSVALGAVFLAVLGVSLWRAQGNWLTTTIIVVLVFAVLVGVSVSNSLRQFKLIWESIKVEVGDDYVARSQLRIPEIRILLNEITSIDEIEGGLCIRTSDKMRTIAIPSALDDVDYHEIQSRLSSWRPIKPKTAIAKVHNGLLLAVLLLGFGVIFISSSLWLVLGVGVAMSSYNGYTYWLMRDAQGIDPQQKRNLLFTFLFPFFITAFKVCFLSGALTSMMGALINMSQSR